MRFTAMATSQWQLNVAVFTRRVAAPSSLPRCPAFVGFYRARVILTSRNNTREMGIIHRDGDDKDHHPGCTSEIVISLRVTRVKYFTSVLLLCFVFPRRNDLRRRVFLPGRAWRAVQTIERCTSGCTLEFLYLSRLCKHIIYRQVHRIDSVLCFRTFCI